MYLITGCTSRLDLLSVMPTTVHLAILTVVEVDQVNKQFVAVGAREAGRVPAGLRTSST